MREPARATLTPAQAVRQSSARSFGVGPACAPPVGGVAAVAGTLARPAMASPSTYAYVSRGRLRPATTAECGKAPLCFLTCLAYGVS